MESSAAMKTTRSTRSKKSATVGADTVDPWSSQTPEKTMQLRGRNRGMALSVKDVKQVAKGLHGHDAGSASRSTKRQLLKSPDVKLKRKAVDVDEAGSNAKLPEKYEMLCETFHSLDCVVKLMRMKGVTPAFSNVGKRVEQLTERRFTYEQLAQIKFLLAEVMALKKVSVLDEATNCMKYDIHISFELDAVKADGKVKGGSGRPQLSKVFRSLVVDFYKLNDQDTEIPQGPLPEPFGKPSEGLSQSTSDHTALLTADPVLEVEDNVKASHISHSFRKSFSQRMGRLGEPRSNKSDTQQTSELEAAKSRLSRCAFKEHNDVASPQMECSMEVPHCDFPVIASPYRSSSSGLQATITKQRISTDTNQSIAKTPSKSVSIPAIPMNATPAPLTPKRSLMSPDDKKSNNTANKLVRRAVRARSLNFDSPVKEDVKGECSRMLQTSHSSVDSELAEILDEDLFQSIMEKERKAMEESDPAISQAKRRRDMIAGLPKLFNMVHFYFRSIKRYVVTKEELIHNMIASDSDFLDKREVEEKLKLLQELAPEYISETIALSGDNLIRVNKVSNVESIRARLSEAI